MNNNAQGSIRGVTKGGQGGTIFKGGKFGEKWKLLQKNGPLINFFAVCV